MGKITVEVKINTFGTMLYSLNHPNLFMGMGPKNIPMGQTFILATCTTPP